VAGPGVLAAGARRGLVALASITGATVVNTIGAKGVFRWDDPLHGGTVGLQEGDAELAEITTADLVVTTGLDPADSQSLTATLDDRRAAEPGAVVDVHPAHLALAAGGWPPADRPGPRPPIYDRIAAIVGPMYAADPDATGAVPPPAAASALAASLPAGGLVVASPGPAGFWIGRTFPTTEPGSVIITTGDPPGTAEAVALLAARSGRAVTLVVDEEPDPSIADSLDDLRERMLAVERWRSEAGDGRSESTQVRAVAVEWSAIESLVLVAGRPDREVWAGLRPQ